MCCWSQMRAGWFNKSGTPLSIAQRASSRMPMGETCFAASSDGTRIAYDVQGEGPALMLLHGGLIQTRRDWRETGYESRLEGEFRVISVDLRGHGESEHPRDRSAYEVGKLCDDLV